MRVRSAPPPPDGDPQRGGVEPARACIFDTSKSAPEPFGIFDGHATVSTMATLEECKVAFEAITPILHKLRPQLRAVVASQYLDHPAYADGNFPIHWQGQNEVLEQPRSPTYLRFTHHPNAGTQHPIGHSTLCCFSMGPKANVHALRDVLVSAFGEEQLLSVDAYNVAVSELEWKAVFKMTAFAYLSTAVDWKVVSRST